MCERRACMYMYKVKESVEPSKSSQSSDEILLQSDFKIPVTHFLFIFFRHVLNRGNVICRLCFVGTLCFSYYYSQHCKGGTSWSTWSLCWGSVLRHSQVTNPLIASHHRFHCPGFKMALLQAIPSVHQQFPQGQYLRVMVTLSRCHEFTLVLFSLELVEAYLNKISLLWFPVCIHNRLSLWLATFC